MACGMFRRPCRNTNDVLGARVRCPRRNDPTNDQLADAFNAGYKKGFCEGVEAGREEGYCEGVKDGCEDAKDSIRKCLDHICCK